MGWSQRGRRWHTGYVSLYAPKHTAAIVHPPNPPYTHASARKHARARVRTYTHTQIWNTYAFHGNSSFVNAPQRYVTRTLPHYVSSKSPTTPSSALSFSWKESNC